MNTVFTRFAALISDGFGVPAAEIVPEATFTDLELDSIALAELIMAVEEEFGIKLPEGELTDTDDLAKAVQLIAVTMDSDGAAAVGGNA
jgi:acyl carrier protein